MYSLPSSFILRLAGVMVCQLGADGPHAVVVVAHRCAVVRQRALVEAEALDAAALFGADVAEEVEGES